MIKSLFLVDTEGRALIGCYPLSLSQTCQSRLHVHGAMNAGVLHIWRSYWDSQTNTHNDKKGQVRLTTLDSLDGCIRNMDSALVCRGGTMAEGLK